MKMINQVTLATLMFASSVFSKNIFAQQSKTQANSQPTKVISISRATSKEELRYELKIAPNNTWGYDIFLNNRLTIHQPSVPGQPGNLGFAKKDNADEVAKLVMYKIKHNQMPPTITKQELDSLKIRL